jgi:hypothetical protein
MSVPVIEVVGTRFRVVAWQPDDQGRFEWFDATDPAVVAQVLRKERYDRVLHGEDSEGPKVANALRERGLLETAPWPAKDFRDKIDQMLEGTGRSYDL